MSRCFPSRANENPNTSLATCIYAISAQTYVHLPYSSVGYIEQRTCISHDHYCRIIIITIMITTILLLLSLTNHVKESSLPPATENETHARTHARTSFYAEEFSMAYPSFQKASIRSNHMLEKQISNTHTPIYT